MKELLRRRRIGPTRSIGWETTMLGSDAGVTLALVLSLASTVLCVAYGWSRWNADDDATPKGDLPSTSDRSDEPAGPGGKS